MNLDGDPRKGRRRYTLGYALIWMMICISAPITWAVDDQESSRAVRAVSGSASLADGRSGFGLEKEALETDADRFFRTYMLPGAAVLTLMIATTLTAVLYPRSEAKK